MFDSAVIDIIKKPDASENASGLTNLVLPTNFPK